VITDDAAGGGRCFGEGPLYLPMFNLPNTSSLWSFAAELISAELWFVEVLVGNAEAVF